MVKLPADFRQELVLKRSAGKFYYSKEPSWIATGKIPEGILARIEAFREAVKKCAGKSKKKGGSVWGVSEYNKCIGDALRTARARLKEVA